MTYVGYSYGTAIGSTYANMFPDKVRAVVIDGVIDPVSYTTGRGDQARTLPSDARLRSEQGAYDTLQGFLRLCDLGGPTCAFSGGNPKRRYDRLARRLIAEPAQLPDGQGGTVPFTYNDLVGTTLGAMYDASSWPDLAELLQELDTLTSPARAAKALRTLRQHLRLNGRAPYEQVLEGFAGVWCLDPINPDSPRPGPGGAPGRPPRPLLRPPLDLVRQHLRPVAGPRQRPLPRPLQPPDGQHRPGRGQPQRPRDPLPGRGEHLPAAGPGPAADRGRLGAHLLVPVLLRRRLRQPLPAHRPRTPKGTVCQVDEVPFAEPAPAASSAAASAHAYLLPPALKAARRG